MYVEDCKPKPLTSAEWNIQFALLPLRPHLQNICTHTAVAYTEVHFTKIFVKLKYKDVCMYVCKYIGHI